MIGCFAGMARWSRRRLIVRRVGPRWDRVLSGDLLPDLRDFGGAYPFCSRPVSLPVLVRLVPGPPPEGKKAGSAEKS